jgi:hypothetical protein
VKQPYNRQYRPPIPVLAIRLYSSSSNLFSGEVSALVDTGSDASLVPLAQLIELQAEETAPGWLVTITGERKPVSLYFVDFYVGDIAFSGIRVIADPDSEDVILGRDVLNKLPIFLDGPEATLTVPDDRITNRLRRE